MSSTEIFSKGKLNVTSFSQSPNDFFLCICIIVFDVLHLIKKN